MKKIYNIPEFADYIKVSGLKNHSLHIVKYEEQDNLLNKSAPITIDFYFLAIKTINAKMENSPLVPEKESEFVPFP